MALDTRAISSSNNGRWMVTENDSAFPARWDVWENKRYDLRGMFYPYTTPKISAISDDGQWILVCKPPVSQGGLGKLPETYAELRTVLGQVLREFHSSEFDAPIIFSGDKAWLVSSELSGGLALWSTADGTRRGRFEGLEEPIECVRFSPDHRLIAAGSEWGTLAVWDVATTRLLRASPLITARSLRWPSPPTGRRCSVAARTKRHAAGTLPRAAS